MISAPPTILLVFGMLQVAEPHVPVLEGGRAKVQIVADTRNTTPAGAALLKDAADWLAESLQRASSAEFPVLVEVNEKPAMIVARADAWPKLARDAGLAKQGFDGYAIVTRADQKRIYIIGNSEDAARHGIADLLRRWGFRWYAPSKKWHVTPQLKELTVNINTVESPQLIERRIWYAYGMSGDDLRPLMSDYVRWAFANRLTLRGLTRTGHSYGNIIGRNKDAFAGNPKLSAMKIDGTRDTSSVPNARKFCISNPDLIALVRADRSKLLETSRRANPAAYMVSVDPSDGQGTCHCPDCKKLGTTTDRVIHLANEVARHLRAKDSRAWVGLYAYSSHRLPPTIDVEPNVYVQVALGFNRTQFSLPELVERWSKKVKAIGLREYYGVEAWDWGLPGRARGGRVAYHRKWIPFYADRRLNGINAETNANWGAQALGLYVASQMMWDPKVQVDTIVDEFFERLFGAVAQPMREFYDKMEAAPPLRPVTLLPLFEDLRTAHKGAADPAVRARIVDLMAYLVYVTEFRKFDRIRSRSQQRGDDYYDALKSLMTYTWRIRHRDVVHYYALARRLCNALPLRDGRPEFSLASKGKTPVWQAGEAFTDAEVELLFQQTHAALQTDGDPTVHFSRYLDPVKVPGDDKGPSHVHGTSQQESATSRFRRGLLGYLVPSGEQIARFGIAPTSKPITMTVTMRDKVIFKREFRTPADDGKKFHDVEIPLPRAFEYRVNISGDFELRVPPENPFVFEASVREPAWISYSGPHYFYVPRGTRELIVDANPRFSLVIPGIGRRDLSLADRKHGKSYIVVDVPQGTDGRVWHTTTQTRGELMLLNTPPLFSFHRHTVFVPREVSESEGLSTKQ